ncbi:MAG TPA: hypothetical protein VKG24_27960 [Pseudolabrys sp.]|nr:hypothetical protein [Pseudolabrys sp.]
MKIHFAVTAATAAVACALSGCAGDRQAAQQYARREYERSVADYRNCMAANQMSTCESERRTMEANKRVLSASMKRQ